MGIPQGIGFGTIKPNDSWHTHPSYLDCIKSCDKTKAMAESLAGFDQTVIDSNYTDCVTGCDDPGPVPYRTIVMLISLICHIAISTLTHYLFVEEKIPHKYDVLDCYKIR